MRLVQCPTRCSSVSDYTHLHAQLYIDPHIFSCHAQLIDSLSARIVQWTTALESNEMTIMSVVLPHNPIKSSTLYTIRLPERAIDAPVHCARLVSALPTVTSCRADQRALTVDTSCYNHATCLRRHRYRLPAEFALQKEFNSFATTCNMSPAGARRTSRVTCTNICINEVLQTNIV